MQTDRLTGLKPGFTQLFELGKQVVVVLITGLEKQLHQRLQAHPPLQGRRRSGELLVSNFKRIQERH
ncbi:hypothetical protein D3C84_1098010 [compost metagenome]